MKPPPQSISVGAVTLVLPHGHAENSDYVFESGGRLLTVNRYDEAVESAAEIAEGRHEMVVSVGEGRVTPSRREAVVCDRREGFVTVYSVLEAPGRIEDSCFLVLRLEHHRFADVAYGGRGVSKDFAKMVESIRVPGERGGVRPVFDFGELTMRVPNDLPRVSPYTFADLEAGLAWSADSSLLRDTSMPLLGARLAPPEGEGVVREAFHSEDAVGELKRMSAPTEPGSEPDAIVYAGVVVERRAALRLAGRGPHGDADRLAALARDILAGARLTETAP